jgi:CheY-like chemotaxis protein
MDDRDKPADGRNDSPEGQPALDDWQRMQRQVEASEQRVREALAQIETLKRGMSAMRMRLDPDAPQVRDIDLVLTATRSEMPIETAARIEALEGERNALLVRVEQLGTLAGQLERECERLHSERLSAEDARKLKTESLRSEARIADIERQHAEAAQHHSAAVAGYMVELNQRTEALQARERDLQQMTEELAVARQTGEEAVAQLAAERQEREELKRQLAELRAAAVRGSPRPAVQAPPHAARPAAPPATAPPPVPAAPPPVASPVSVQPRLSYGFPVRPGGARPISGPATLIHLEENKAFRDAMQNVIDRLPGARYLNAPDGERGSGKGTRFLAVNLINRTHDPLAAIVASTTEAHEVFAYCADGTNGFVFGLADFFPASTDADTCVTRLLESCGSLQRLLVVSDNMEMTGTLRGALSRIRCSTSVALDLRQVMDLLTMIEPQVVVIDLGLPRGDGLRLVCRLRSEPRTRDLPLAILLPATMSSVELRQHALLAVREQSLSAADLAQAFSQRIGFTPADTAKKTADFSQSA